MPCQRAAGSGGCWCDRTFGDCPGRPSANFAIVIVLFCQKSGRLPDSACGRFSSSALERRGPPTNHLETGDPVQEPHDARDMPPSVEPAFPMPPPPAKRAPLGAQPIALANSAPIAPATIPTQPKPTPTPPKAAARAEAVRSRGKPKPTPPKAAPRAEAVRSGGFGLLQFASSVISTLDEVVESIESTAPPYEDFLPPSKPHHARQPFAVHSAYDELVLPARPRGETRSTVAAEEARRAASAPASPVRVRHVRSTHATAPSSPAEPGSAGLWVELSTEFSEVASTVASSIGIVDRWIDGTLDSLFERVLAAPGAGGAGAGRVAVDERAAPWCFREPTLGALEPEAQARMLLLSLHGGSTLLSPDSLPADGGVAERLEAGSTLTSAQLDAMLPLARAAIAGDPHLLSARQALVPSRLSERAFWCAYARHCLAAKRALVLERGEAALQLASRIADEPWSPTSRVEPCGAAPDTESWWHSSAAGGSTDEETKGKQSMGLGSGAEGAQAAAARLVQSAGPPASAMAAWVYELERCLAEIPKPKA